MNGKESPKSKFIGSGKGDGREDQKKKKKLALPWRRLDLSEQVKVGKRVLSRNMD